MSKIIQERRKWITRQTLGTTVAKDVTAIKTTKKTNTPKVSCEAAASVEEMHLVAR